MISSLFSKLNFKNQNKVFLLNHPESFLDEIILMKDIVEFKTKIGINDEIDFALIFVKKQEEIDNNFELIHPCLGIDPVIWFCYPKMSSKKYKCDFNRDTGWKKLGDTGYEPVRMVAIDEDWSALRFRNVKNIKTITRRESFALTKEAKSRTTQKNI